MFRALRHAAAAFAAALAFAAPASAATSGTDFTDLWFNPSESGWGLNIIHQSSIIFATLYVYNSDGTPRFYSASETRATSSTSFSGPLYDTRGTYFGAPWAGNFSATPVGTLSVSFSTPTTGTLTYNVGGVSVTKQIQRFAFALESLSGNYLGGLTASSTCGGASQLTLIFDTLQVSHSGSSITLTVNFFNAQGAQSRCVFNGTYSQSGRLGNVTGTYSCTFGGTPGNAGSFTISQIDAQATGFTGRFNGSDNFCSSHSGYFGGVRDVI